MAKFDLELLRIFDEIYKTGSVTRAADNMNLPQSTVSIGLAKLRSQFDDRLFSRTSSGMAPTPRAQKVIKDVRNCLASLEQALTVARQFDPATDRREFRLCMTDISEIVLLPTLLNHLRTVAPGVQLDVSKIHPGTPHDLESGAVDLAVGFMPHLDIGFYQQKLFDQDFVCLVSKHHPRIGTCLDRKAFLREGHIQIKSSGTGHAIVDKAIQEQNLARKLVLRLPSFLGVARIVAQTEYIVTVPYRYGMAVVDQEAIRMFDPPIALPSFSVRQHWHERYHEDSCNVWMRAVMRELFSAPHGRGVNG